MIGILRTVLVGLQTGRGDSRKGHLLLPVLLCSCEQTIHGNDNESDILQGNGELFNNADLWVTLNNLRLARNAMKISNLIAILVLLFSSALQANELAISHIRLEYKTIRDALPTLKKQTIELPDYSTDGGEATAYRDGHNNIRLIRVELYGESGKEFEEYYYQGKILFFAFYESHRYNVPYYVTEEMAKDAGGIAFDARKTKIAQDRYYFDNGKMIRWIKEKREIGISSNEFTDAESDILKFSSELLAKFK